MSTVDLILPPYVSTWRPTIFPGSSGAVKQGCVCPSDQTQPGRLMFANNCPVHPGGDIIRWVNFLSELCGHLLLRLSPSDFEDSVASADVVAAELLSFTISLNDFNSPIPAGTVVGTFTVEPDDWVGNISLSEDDVDLFEIVVGAEGQLRLVTTSSLADARVYDVIATADP